MTNSNKTLAFLPGWGFKASIFEDITASFHGEAIMLLDLPKPSDLDSMVDTIANQLTNGATLVAWSLGGLLAIELANRYPEKIAKLVLVCTTPKFVTEDEWLGIDPLLVDQFRQSAKTDMDRLCSRFLKITQYPNKEKELFLMMKQHMLTNADDLLHYLELLFTLDVRASFKKLGNHVTYLLSESDAIIPSKIERQIRAMNKDIKIQILKNAGHVPFLTHKSEFMELINASY